MSTGSDGGLWGALVLRISRVSRNRFGGLVLAVLIVSAVLLLACSDDDQSQPEPSQQQQRQEQPDEQPDEQTVSASPATQPRQEQASERALSRAPSPDQTQDQSQAGPSLEQVEARYNGWRDQLTSLEFEAALEVMWADGTQRVGSVARMQVEPARLWSSHRSESGRYGEDAYTVLITDDGAFRPVPDLGGWTRTSAPDAYSDLFWLSPIGAIVGGDDDLRRQIRISDHFRCVERDSNGLSAVEWEGVAAWQLECDFGIEVVVDVFSRVFAPARLDLPDPDEWDEEMLELLDEIFTTRTLRVVIEQASGAPLLTEVDFVIDFGDDSSIEGGSSTRLRSWNRPLEIPSPEPLVEDPRGRWPMPDYSLFGSDTDSALEVLEDVDAWLDLTWPALAVQIRSEAVVDGERRRREVDINRDTRIGAYEESVVLDGAPTQRLLWHRQGLWQADNPEHAPDWAPSTPEQAGLSQSNVDDYLRYSSAFPWLVSAFWDLEPYAEYSRGRMSTSGGPAKEFRQIYVSSSSSTVAQARADDPQLERAVVELVRQHGSWLWESEPEQITVSSFQVGVEWPQKIFLNIFFSADGRDMWLRSRISIVGTIWDPLPFSPLPGAGGFDLEVPPWIARAPKFDAATAEEALEFLGSWLRSTESLAVQIRADVMVDGEERRLEIDINRDPRIGAYEESVVIDGTLAERMLWTRDGLWLADHPDPTPRWTRTSPLQLGDRGHPGVHDVDSFLAVRRQLPGAHSGHYMLPPAEFEPGQGGGRIGLILTAEAKAAIKARDEAFARGEGWVATDVGVMGWMATDMTSWVLRPLSVWGSRDPVVVDAFELTIDLFEDGRPPRLELSARVLAEGSEIALNASIEIVGDDRNPVPFTPTPERGSGR